MHSMQMAELGNQFVYGSYMGKDKDNFSFYSDTNTLYPLCTCTYTDKAKLQTRCKQPYNLISIRYMAILQNFVERQFVNITDTADNDRCQTVSGLCKPGHSSGLKTQFASRFSQFSEN